MAVAAAELRMLVVGHGTACAVSAGIAGQVNPLDGGQDVCHKQAAAWLQDDSNPHEKGFNVAGEGGVDPHIFRVDGEVFMTSTVEGMMSVFW